MVFCEWFSGSSKVFYAFKRFSLVCYGFLNGFLWMVFWVFQGFLCFFNGFQWFSGSSIYHEKYQKCSYRYLGRNCLSLVGREKGAVFRWVTRYGIGFGIPARGHSTKDGNALGMQWARSIRKRTPREQITSLFFFSNEVAEAAAAWIIPEVWAEICPMQKCQMQHLWEGPSGQLRCFFCLGRKGRQD